MAGKAPPRRTIMQLVKNGGNNDPPLRWSDIPDAREHPNFKNKNTAMIDAKFEIIFQEAYFNFRIRTLLVAFFSSGKVKETDRKAIFSSIEKVLRFSDVFLADLEQCWQRDIFLSHVFDVIRKHEANFDVYAKHGASLKSTLQHLAKLKADKKEFVAVIEQWKQCPDNIYHLDLETFLSLPQDRIMSLIMSSESAALLVEKNDPEYKSSQAAMKALRKISGKCNLPTTRTEVRPAAPPAAPPVKPPETKPETIFDKLIFSEEVPKFQVETPGRQLILMEEMTLVRHTGNPITKMSSRHLVLFNDILLVTVKQQRKEERYLIEDYCYLTQLEVKNTEDFLALMPDPSLTEIQAKLLLIKLVENHEKKAILMLFACAQEKNRESWQNILLHPTSTLNQAPAPVADDQDTDDDNDLLPHINRTSQDQKIIEELKLKQQARKKNTDWTVSDESLQYNNDGLMRPMVVTPDDVGVGVQRSASNVGVQRAASNVGDTGGVAGEYAGNGMDRTSYQIPRASSAQSSTPTTPKKLAPLLENEPRKESGVEATITFDRMLEYPPGIKVFPLVSSVRWIVKQGSIMERWQYEDRKYTEGKVAMTMTLFNDVLFFTVQKKNEPRLRVISYGMRNLVDVTRVRRIQNMPSKYLTDAKDRFMLMIHLLENHKRKEEIMVVSVSTANERDAWLNAIPTPPPADDVEERVFDPWDCPLVIATQPFKPVAPNQLLLSLNDKLHVRRRGADGWCEGARVSDGEVGLFPGHCTTELDSPHKYAKSVRRRLQYLADARP